MATYQASYHRGQAQLSLHLPDRVNEMLAPDTFHLLDQLAQTSALVPVTVSAVGKIDVSELEGRETGRWTRTVPRNTMWPNVQVV